MNYYPVGGWYTTANNISIYPTTTGSAVDLGTLIAQQSQQAQRATDWQRAQVKAEPDDEFSWLRRRVREIEELAFA